MANKIIPIKCPECDADLDIEEGRKVMFCSYCGRKIMSISYRSSICYFSFKNFLNSHGKKISLRPVCPGIPRTASVCSSSILPLIDCFLLLHTPVPEA